MQEYHYHLGAVNTITFIEENRMFVSTSDDKTIRLWELGVPVQVKAIADPSMHSMPAAAMHPTGKFLCFQSLDSQIVTYAAGAKLRPNKKKIFKGHVVGGNACQVCSRAPCACDGSVLVLSFTANFNSPKVWLAHVLAVACSPTSRRTESS